MPDIGAQVIADLEARISDLPHREPLDRDAIELIVIEADRAIDRLNRCCNTILNRPGGIPVSAIDAIQDLKVAASRLRYYLDHPNP